MRTFYEIVFLLILYKVCGSNFDSKSECSACIPQSNKGWCGNETVGECIFGNEKGPTEGQCHSEWNYYLCPPSKVDIYDIYKGGQNSTNDCFKKINCTVDPTDFKLKVGDVFQQKFYAPIESGSVIIDGQIVIMALICNPNNDSLQLAYSLYDESLQYYYSLPLLPCSDGFQTFTLDVPAPDNKWWTSWDYDPISEHFVHLWFSSDRSDSDYCIAIRSVRVILYTKNVDPKVSSITPSLLPSCFECKRDITVTVGEFGKMEYSCTYTTRRGTDTTDAVITTPWTCTCPVPTYSTILPYPDYGQPASVVFQVLPKTATTNVAINSFNILFYMSPLVESISPEYGPATGGTEVDIWGLGFFVASSVTIYLTDQVYGTTIAVKDHILIDPPSKISFTTPPVTQWGSYMVRVSMNGYDFPKGLPYVFAINSSFTPIIPPFISDPCHDCLTIPSQKYGWCGANNGAPGQCNEGTPEGPINGTQCDNWNWWVCPDGIILKQYLFPEVVLSPLYGDKFCPLFFNCALNRNFTMIHGTVDIFYYNVDIPEGYVIQSVDLDFKGSLCGDGDVQLAVYFDDFLIYKPVLKGIQAQCVDGQYSMFEQTFTLPANFWWPEFNRSKDYLHSFTIEEISPYKKYVAAVKVLIIFNIKNVDPLVSGPSIQPEFFPYCVNCNHTFDIFAKNYLKFNYTCQITLYHNKNKIILSTPAIYYSATVRKCTFHFPADLKVTPPSLGIPDKVPFRIYPELPSDIAPTFTFADNSVQIFATPVYLSLSPSNGTCGGQPNVVHVNGYGFFQTMYYARVYVNSTKATMLIKDNNTIVFSIPYDCDIFGEFDQTTLCVQVSMLTDELSSCLNYTFYRVKNDTGDQGLWEKLLELLTRYWPFLMVICIVILGIIVLFIFIRRKYRRNYGRYTLISSADEFDRTAIEKAEISPADVTLKEVIGVGSFATVYHALWLKTPVAVKIVRSRSKSIDTITEQFLEEALLMVKFRHPHIVSFLGAYLTQGPDMFIVMEYMPRGSLNDILHTKSIIIEPGHVKNFAVDCCKGMAYLHSCNVIHRDLKTHNLLIDNDWKLKVSDFGLSRVIKDSNVAQTLTACGTPSWAAPEVLKDQKYSSKADIYSFAMCLWEMCTREDPYADLTAPQVVIFIAVKGKRLKIPDTVMIGFADIIRDCWQDDPTSRPSFTNVIEKFDALSFPDLAYETPRDSVGIN